MVKINGFELKDDSYYSREGLTWVKIEPDGNARNGLCDLAVEVLRIINLIEPKPKGTMIPQGGTLARLMTPKGALTFHALISGEVVEVNDEVIKNPLIVREDPYGKGWISLVKPTNLENELKTLLKGSDPEAVNWYREEIERRIKKRKKT